MPAFQEIQTAHFRMGDIFCPILFFLCASSFRMDVTSKMNSRGIILIGTIDIIFSCSKKKKNARGGRHLPSLAPMLKQNVAV